MFQTKRNEAKRTISNNLNLLRQQPLIRIARNHRHSIRMFDFEPFENKMAFVNSLVGLIVDEYGQFLQGIVGGSFGVAVPGDFGLQCEGYAFFGEDDADFACVGGGSGADEGVDGFGGHDDGGGGGDGGELGE